MTPAKPPATKARKADPMKVKVQSFDAKSKGGDIELSDDVFGVEPRADILHRVVTWQLEKRRATARPTRERSEVARTGKKFGKQKGGGTARHGDRRAPIFVGGGKAHGARLRDFDPSLNKKVRALGLRMALSAKAMDGKLVVLDNLDLDEAKTAALKEQLGRLNLGRNALVIDGDALNVGFAKASSNLREVDLLPAVGANVYDILNHETLVLTRAAVEKLEARFNG
jgi:large subunit ribosomal protein L4